jgi:CspA family cold shock protein
MGADDIGSRGLTVMGRGRDLRGGGGGRGRRAQQDDDGHPILAFEPQPVDLIPRHTVVSPVTTVDATVKWFSLEKGFGFAAIADGSGDAFLPLKVVRALGRDMLMTGAKLKVFLGRGEKGQYITKIVAVDESGITQT